MLSHSYRFLLLLDYLVNSCINQGSSLEGCSGGSGSLVYIKTLLEMGYSIKSMDIFISLMQGKKMIGSLSLDTLCLLELI